MKRSVWLLPAIGGVVLLASPLVAASGRVPTPAMCRSLLGAQVVATDYPVADPTIGPYVVALPGSAVGRCNPVTAPRWCRDRDVENAVGLRTG